MIDGFRKLLDAEIKPVADSYSDTLMPAEEVRELLAALVDFGFVRGWTDTSDGGLGIDYLTSGLLYEELARVFPDLAGTAFITEGAVTSIAEKASVDLIARYLPDLLSGNKIGCHGITEPGCGSNPTEIRTRAVRDGDHFILNGERTWISNAGRFRCLAWFWRAWRTAVSAAFWSTATNMATTRRRSASSA